MRDQDLKREFLKKLQAGNARAPSTSNLPSGMQKPPLKDHPRNAQGQECLALSVDPSQVQEYRDLTKAHGLSGIQYMNDGRCMVFDQKHKTKLAKLHGYVDRSSTNGG